MAIRFSSKSRNFTLSESREVVQWLTRIINQRGKSVGNINYLFCTDEELIDYNRQYLQHDTYTDIITFDYVVGNLISGDILISLDRVGENAAAFSVTEAHELHRVLVHGVLHLLGQGDKSEEEAREMRRQEEEALALWEDMFHVEQQS